MNTTARPPSPVHFGHQGRVVIVTGGAQGIGEACARRFARENAKVVIADVAEARGQRLADELGALYLACDVGRKTNVDAAVAHTLARHGQLPTRLAAGIEPPTSRAITPRPNRAPLAPSRKRPTGLDEASRAFW